MIELLKSIKDNYDIFIDTNKIHKLGATTINDIFLINIDNKKYIVKIYNYVQSNFPIKLIDGFSNAYKKCVYTYWKTGKRVAHEIWIHNKLKEL